MITGFVVRVLRLRLIRRAQTVRSVLPRRQDESPLSDPTHLWLCPYCTWDLRGVRGWAADQPMTGWHRNKARWAFINDRWLLRRIQEENED